ncbi:SgcJ/EcaC family oxidoreductase [Actinoallomurus acaciae]|uniref:SgcJ/EcaC family oxidoreductase n=1 Tax=Actinoallomurus acaciae TaxID=502577 RepID=A0ABV5YSZ1_9ACTN
MSEMLRVGVLVGSTRPARRARAVAEWICAGPEAGELGLDPTVVDLEEIGLPMLAEPDPPAFGRYALEHTKAWSELVAGFDAYVLVTPEYNHSTTAVLKNALDHLYAEWQDKAVGFAGYGTGGGLRAVEHLRGITAELGMAGVGPQVALDIFEDFDDQGRCEPRARQTEARRRMLTGLARWGRSLRGLRAAPPASDGERPRLHSPVDAAEASAAVERLIETLQGGGDTTDADEYDRMFADDILWGSPYGRTLAGYEQLNEIHHTLMAKSVAPPSRFEPVQVLAPAPDVTIAHIRRRALPDGTGEPGFSEMAMYVLIKRNGTWWLAAGQNTPIADPVEGPATAGGARPGRRGR